MNITNVLSINLDSGEDQYKYLFHPSEKIQWLDDKVQKLAERVRYYYTSACHPYFEIQVKVEKTSMFLKALLDCMEVHKINLDKDVSVYTNKDIDDLSDDEFEVNLLIEQTWTIEDYEDLIGIQKSLNTLINNINQELNTKWLT